MYRVLLVDDEPVILAGLRKLIDWEELGLEVAGSAAGGAEALALMERGPMDILITDIRMPEMTGLELIARVRDRGWNTKILIVSSYDDFEYMKSGFHYNIENYILKPVDQEELKTALLYVVEKIEGERARSWRQRMMDSVLMDNVLSSWALGAMDHSALRERLELFGVRQDRRHYTLSAVRLWDPDYGGGVNSEYVRNQFFQSCGPGEDLYATFNLCGDLLLIHACDQLPREGEAQAAMRATMEGWQPGGGWFIAVGKPVDQPALLRESYRSAMELMLYAYLEPRRDAVTAVSQLAENRELFRRLDLDEAWLRELLLVGDREALDQRLEALESRLRRLEEGEAWRRELGDVLYQIFSGVEEMRKRLCANSGPDLDFCPALCAGSPGEGIAALCALLRRYWEEHPFGEERVHPVVARVLRCIEEEYPRELSLKTLAGRFNVSQTYLGRIFKQDTGLLFTDYLCGYRIEKAKELLLSTSLRSGDIARETGFHNPNYFANVFKKTVGVYPTRFRQSAQEGRPGDMSLESRNSTAGRQDLNT